MGGKKVLACSGDLRLASNFRLYRKPPAFMAGLRTGINSIRLTLDAAGNLYETTSQAATYGCGTVFRLTKSATGWTESLLHFLACVAAMEKSQWRAPFSTVPAMFMARQNLAASKIRTDTEPSLNSRPLAALRAKPFSIASATVEMAQDGQANSYSTRVEIS